MSQVTSAPSSKEYELDSSFLDSSCYCRVCFKSHHATSKFRYFVEDTQLVRPRHRNYEARYGLKGKTGDKYHTQPVTNPHTHQPPKGSRLFSENMCTIKAAACNMRLATARCQILRIRTPRPPMPPTLRLTRNIHHTVAVASQKTNDCGCGSSGS